MNIRNHANFIGRLTRKPVLKSHKDGSATALVTIAVRDNFLSTRGGKRNYQTQYIDAQAFIAKGSKIKSVYEALEKGDLIAIGAHLESAQWIDADGQKVNQLQVVIDTIDTRIETSAAKAARGNKSAAADETDDVNPYATEDTK